MTPGMDGLGSSSLINALDLAGSPAVSANPTGDLKGVPVTLADPTTTQGIRKNDLVDGEAQTEPPTKTLSMRTIKKADPEAVATIKKGLAKARDLGRSALKTIKHGWGELKRFLLKENFKPVDAGALKNVSNDAKKSLAPKLEKFNVQLKELNESKKEMLGHIDEMQAFEDLYKESLEVLDDASKLSEAKGVVDLPVPGEDGKVEYVRIRAPKSGKADDRDKQVAEFKEFFKGKDEYKAYSEADDKVAEINVKRENLKTELKDLRQEMLEVFSDDLNKRTETRHAGKEAESKSDVSDTKSRLNKELDGVKEAQQKDLAYQRGVMSQAQEKLDALLDKETAATQKVANLKKQIKDAETDISSLNNSVKRSRGKAVKESLESALEGQKSELNKFKSQLETAQSELKAIPSQRKAEQDKLRDAKEAEKKLTSDSSIKEKEKELAKVDKQTSKTLKAADKQIDKVMKAELTAFKKAIGEDRTLRS